MKKADPNQPEADKERPTNREESDRGAPIEKFHGEITDGSRIGDPRDLEEETLDRSAPFNKSYGTRDEEGSGRQR